MSEKMIGRQDEQLEQFKVYLKRKGAAPNTIAAYTASVRLFFSLYSEIDIVNLNAYKVYLLENFKPNTVNIRIFGINRYIEGLESGIPLKLESYKLPSVRCQQHPFLDNIISNRDYERLKRSLKRDGNMFWYFVVRFLAATGARISELVQIKVEHVQIGFMDLYPKGGKLRRIYFPESLCMEMLFWLELQGKDSGFIFVNRKGQQITSRGISSQLKVLAVHYHISPDTVYPHSFRHRFAKNFLGKFNDITLLADLMGHESIETTRIYLTKSSQEQRKLIDKVVTW